MDPSNNVSNVVPPMPNGAGGAGGANVVPDDTGDIILVPDGRKSEKSKKGLIFGLIGVLVVVAIVGVVMGVMSGGGASNGGQNDYSKALTILENYMDYIAYGNDDKESDENDENVERESDKEETSEAGENEKSEEGGYDIDGVMATLEDKPLVRIILQNHNFDDRVKFYDNSSAKFGEFENELEKNKNEKSEVLKRIAQQYVGLMDYYYYASFVLFNGELETFDVSLKNEINDKVSQYINNDGGDDFVKSLFYTLGQYMEKGSLDNGHRGLVEQYNGAYRTMTSDLYDLYNSLMEEIKNDEK